MTADKVGQVTRRDVLKLGATATALTTLPSRAIGIAEKPKDRPNILFIMADQHRGDCLGVAGNRDIRTPNLDTIAKEGVRFRNACSSTPSCIPARAAILTGLSPWHHGLLGMDGWPIPSKYPVEMPRALHDAGYFTITIGKNHFYPDLESHGFDQMLLDEHHDIPSIYRSDYHSWFWTQYPDLVDPSGQSVTSDVVDGCGFGWKDFWNAYQAKAYPYPERLHRTQWVGETAARFLHTYRRSQPFFLKVSFVAPHSPYTPPERLMRQYMEASLPRAVHGGWSEKYRPRSGPGLDIWHGDLGPDQVHRSRAGYYGQVTFIDEQIGKILEELDARGWLENTLIFYSSDHGDMLGDHFLWRKGYPYQRSVNIPMLMRWPKGLIDAERGQVLSQVTELRDLLPTFLDAASAHPQGRLDGRSLLSLVDGKAGTWRPYIDLEHATSFSAADHWNALTDGQTKYILHAYDGSEQLFDLEHDPDELVDLAAVSSHRQELLLWRQRMVDHLSERGDAWVKDGKLMLRREGVPISPHYPREEAKNVVIVTMKEGIPDLPHRE